MGYPTKVQLISRKKGADQYYINFPTALAEAMEFEKGEVIEWIIEDKANIIAHRPMVPASPVSIEKKRGITPKAVGTDLGKVRGFGLQGFLLCAKSASSLTSSFDLPGPSHNLGLDYRLRTAV